MEKEICKVFAQDAILLQAILANSVTHTLANVVYEFIKDWKKTCVLFGLPEVGSTKFVKRDTFIIFVLAIDIVEIGGDGIKTGIDSKSFGRTSLLSASIVVPLRLVYKNLGRP